MCRVALALMLGIACFLVAYGQFRGLPGHVEDSPSVAVFIQETLVACISSEASELCPFSRDYMSQIGAIPDATTLILLVAAKFAMLVAFA